MALILSGRPEGVQGLRCVSWKDDPKLRLQIAALPDGKRDGAPRLANMWIRQIVVHSSLGIPGGRDQRPQVILPGLGTNSNAGEREVAFWSTPGHQAGAHLAVDFDGTVYCMADLMAEETFHVGGVPGINSRSIGIEVIQRQSDAGIYQGQIDATVTLVDWLTKRLSIQRQIPDGYHGKPWTRLAAGARDFVGVFGHRDADSNRGAGDPGDAIMSSFKAAGYEAWNLDAGADLAAWKDRQRTLGINSPDGIPGMVTVSRLQTAGHLSGLWVPRPSDDITELET